MNLKEKLISVFDQLPKNKQEEVVDFANYLEELSLNATDYLFSTEANKKHLLKAIENIENGENLIEISLEDLEKGNLPNV
jgi:PHD/YefM family antitoxin component YafN of YafNO toxin-antitoxin module